MDEHEFLKLAEEALRRLEKGLAQEEDEIEADLADGVLTIEFEDGMKYIINRQRAAQQIWVAAGARAWHFGYEKELDTWITVTDGEELFTCIGDLIKEKAGVDIRFF